MIARAPLVLVACSAAKLEQPAPARDLYTGALFRKARAWAEAHGDEWLILSAAWGVVSPDRVLEPYNRRLPSARAARQSWARSVANQLYQHRDRQMVALAGADYLAWSGPDFPHLERPLAGLGIGQQLHWLTVN